MLIPNLEENEYEAALVKLIDKIQKTNGEVQESPYYLSDRTPVIRAIIPTATLAHYENDLAIYRIEETDFFSVDATQNAMSNLETLTLNSEINVDSLPIVVVLDSGVIFPSSLSPLITKNGLHQDQVVGTEIMVQRWPVGLLLNI
jgi:hypothetical protein